MFTKVTIATLFASLVAAQTTLPNGQAANPITRPLNEVVPACKPFTITWTPNTAGPMKITLLKGPSTNVIPQYDIATGIANSGTFTWTPAANLDATAGNTGYGLNLTDMVTGAYQYSTQFGISKDGCAAVPSSSAAAPASSSVAVYPASSIKASSTPVGYPVSTPVYPTAPPKSTLVYSTVAPCNSTIATPVMPSSMPNSPPTYPTSATTSRLPQISGNAAPALKAGAGLVGAVAAFAFML